MEVLYEWIISQVCEEFHCLPLQAIDALERDYNGLLFKILDLRGYSRAYRAYQEGARETDSSRRPSGPAIDRVTDTAGDIMKEDYEQRAKPK